jgi:hypothetical protein
MSENKTLFLISDEKYACLRPLFVERGFSEIELKELSADDLADCHDAYIELVSGLSLKFHGIAWWCNPLSEKNEHGSALYPEIVNYYALYKTLEDRASARIYVACSSVSLAQLKASDLAEKIEIIPGVPPAFSDLYSRLFPVILFLPKIKWLYLKGILRSLRVKIVLKKKFLIWNSQIRPAYVLRTWLNQRNLSKLDRYQDPYFGKLPAYLQSKKFKPLILAGIYDNFWRIINFFRNSDQVTVLPEEFFLGISDYFKAAIKSIFNKIKVREKIEFIGVDITFLLRDSLRNAYFSGAIFLNLLRYQVGKRLAEKLGDFIYLQPFENYAWEKAMILGLRSGKKDKSALNIFGFQHAFICQDSFKYFFGKEEEPLMPLPERIITLGDVTRRILSGNNRYSSLDLRSGCALRQEYINVFRPLTRGKLKTILVPLTMVRHECLKIIGFLAKAKLKDTGFAVILRFHPLFGYEVLKKHLPHGLPPGFMVNNDKSVVEAIGKADTVVYTWSTVAVEALRLGLPVIHLDILQPLRVDPLFQCPGLRYRVESPQDLAVTLERINGLSNEQFLKERSMSLEYLKGYFLPVDEQHLRNFLP